MGSNKMELVFWKPYLFYDYSVIRIREGKEKQI